MSILLVANFSCVNKKDEKTNTLEGSWISTENFMEILIRYTKGLFKFTKKINMANSRLGSSLFGITNTNLNGI